MRRSRGLPLAIALISAAAGCGGESGPPPVRTPSRLTVATGDNQEVVVGTFLPATITFVVADAQGPLPGVAVAFAISDPTGFTSASADTSDQNGTVSVNWAVGGTVGTQTLTATVPGVAPATVTATVRAGPVALLTPISEPSQFVVVGRLVASPPAVRVTDAFSNPLSGQEVSFLDPTGRSTVVGGLTTSDATGRAAVASWRVGAAPGSYTLQASAGQGVIANFVAFGVPALVQIAAGNSQQANAGTLTPVAPAILALGDGGQPLAGVGVTFAVTGGGGRVFGSALATTGATGIATASGWVLGPTPGPNELSATVVGLPAVAFVATGLAATPGSITATSATGSTGFAGNFAAIRPSVRVTDAQGAPVAGRPVTFAVTAGAGTLAGANQTTDFDGRAALGAWRLGAPGPQGVAATVAGLPPVTYAATASTPPASSYAITVRFIGPEPTASQRATFEEAAARWGSLIVGDLTDIPFNSGDPDSDLSFCGGQTLNEVIDDLLIFARIEAIDGPGNILGQAGACYIRDADTLSVIGIMQFDAADVAALEAQGRFREVVLHEMGHVIGVGSLWSLKDLISGRGTGDPFFTGTSARMAFAAADQLPGGFAGNAVPVENAGGAGTRDVHWRESVFDTELMTGLLDAGVVNPLSAVTVASLRDQGYLVNDALSDPFTLAAALRAAAGTPLRLHLAEWAPVIRVVDRRGRVIRAVDLRPGPFR